MKDKKSLRIVFMGTPVFAATSLEALINNGYNVVAVITAPDKPAGRGLQLQQSAVKQMALEKSIPVLQPEKLKSPEFIEELKSYNADLQVVVAFRMLPEIVWNMPQMGTINVHGSLLPNYRGAAPINHAIINGEKETGVTTFKLKHQIDTGDMLLNEKLSIGENETAGELHDRMMVAGAALLIRTLDQLLENKIMPQPQPFSSEDKHAPKIHTEDCRLDFNQTATQVHNRIRGLSPFPGAFTTLSGKTLKIYRTRVNVSSTKTPGTITTDNKNQFLIHCKEGSIEVLELQLEGKKRMAVEDFLRGYRFTDLSVGN